MFDFDAGKLLIVGVIALIFIPPKDLPRVLREVGQFVGRMRRMASDFQGQFMDAMREADMADVRQEAKKLADSARVDIGFDSVYDLDRQMVAKRPEAPPEPEETSRHEASQTEPPKVGTPKVETLHHEPNEPGVPRDAKPTSKPDAPASAPSHSS